MKYFNCLVTGASSGIGMHIAINLSNYAKHIYIVGRNIKKLEEVNDIITKKGCKCTIVPLDLCNESGIENLSQQILERDGFIDILVLSAGQIRQLSPINSINFEDSRYIMELNYFSNLRLIKSFHGLLKISKNPQLAVISSIIDEKKRPYWGIYQPIMHALNELVLTYASENKNSNIKANIFCPGDVDTNFRNEIMPGEDKKKINKPEDVAYKITEYVKNCNFSGEIIFI